MRKVKMGNSDLEVSRINLGGNVFGWTLDEKQSFNILDAFAQGGGNFIDTADTYSWWVNGVGGQSETIIGKWMKEKGNRQNIIVASKVGSQTKEHPVDVSKKHILKSIDETLQRLQTDYLDLYYTHFDDEQTPVEETLSAYDEIIKAGKVRYIGASNISPERLTETFAAAQKYNLPKYAALQPLYNLMERSKYETQYAGMVKKYDMAVMPYYALAAGFLTGKYRSEADLKKSVRGTGAQKYLNEKGFKVLAAMDVVAAKHSTSPAAVAIAWLLAQAQITAPIASATSISQLDTLFIAEKLNMDALDLENLNSATAEK